MLSLLVVVALYYYSSGFFFRLVVTLSLVALASCLSETGRTISQQLDRCVSQSEASLECARNMKDLRQRMYEKIEEVTIAYIVVM